MIQQRKPINNLHMKKIIFAFIILFVFLLPMIIFYQPRSMYYRQRPDTQVLKLEKQFVILHKLYLMKSDNTVTILSLIKEVF